MRLPRNSKPLKSQLEAELAAVRAENAHLIERNTSLAILVNQTKEEAAQRIEELERENQNLRASLKWRDIEKEKPPRDGDSYWSTTVEVRMKNGNRWEHDKSAWKESAGHWMGHYSWTHWRPIEEMEVKDGK